MITQYVICSCRILKVSVHEKTLQENYVWISFGETPQKTCEIGKTYRWEVDYALMVFVRLDIIATYYVSYAVRTSNRMFLSAIND